jgi:type 1 glutamine amidotransferase
MKRITAYLAAGLVMMIVGGLLTVQAQAAEKKIRILVTVGGHGYEEGPFDKMFNEMKGVEYKKVSFPQACELLKPGLEKEYDAIVMYDMFNGMKPDQQKAFADLIGTGIGILSWHHNLGSNQNWDEFTKIRGGRYMLKAAAIDGKEYPPSTYAHGQEVKVTVADKDHPITKGIQDFVIADETYAKCYVSPSVRVLLKTDHPKSCPELAWVHEYGKSRVFHLMLGHDSKAWQNPAFLEILGRGIRWVARQD